MFRDLFEVSKQQVTVLLEEPIHTVRHFPCVVDQPKLLQQIILHATSLCCFRNLPIHVSY